MIVLFNILTLFRFKALRSSSLTLNEIMIALMAKGTQDMIGRQLKALASFPKICCCHVINERIALRSAKCYRHYFSNLSIPFKGTSKTE